MKRLFSNKSGFSLAEIIVAIAVFAVMMAMIMQMLRLSIDQRNANYKFAEDLQEQQDALVINGKDTTSLPEGTTFDGQVKLSFKKDPTDDSETPLNINMDYVVKQANSEAEDVNEGLNYFVGDFDYSADGVGGGSGSGGSGGLGQSARYDTRLTGTKGMKDITISVQKNPTLPAGVTLGSGQTAYKITVSADSSDMIADDIPDSQLRMYFYSTTKWKSQKVEVKEKVVDEDGVETEQVVDTYYKKVYDKAKIAKFIPDDGNLYKATQISDYGAKITTALSGGGAVSTGFNPSKDTSFIVIFNGDPEITANSFGGNSGGVYNKSNVYAIEKNPTTGKYESVQKFGKQHENIYGSYQYEISYDPIV